MTRILDRISKKQIYLLISTSGGFFLWGIIASIAPLATSWPFMKNQPEYMTTLVLLTAPTFLMIGNVVMGILSDHLGRRRIFLFTMFMYGTGIILIALSFSPIMLLVGIALSEFGVGGEEPPALALLSENFSVKTRTKTLSLIPNFNNIGSAVAALIFFLAFLSSIEIQRLFLLLITFVVIGIIAYSRLNLPESYLWLKDTGKSKEAITTRAALKIDSMGKKSRAPSMMLGVFILGTLAISQYLTFGLMAFIIGPYIFPHITDLIVLVATIGASAAGFIAVPLIATGKKMYTMLSFFGGFITVLIILIMVRSLSNLWIFMPLLFFNMIFSEFAWVSRTNLEPELFKTLHRSTMISIVRVFAMTMYIVAIIFTATFSLFQYILLNVVLWGVGFGAALLWFLMGIETKDLSLDYEESRAKSKYPLKHTGR